MTYAPKDLLAVRDYLMRTLGLSGDAVGIVGDPDHAASGGYHEGNDDLARVGRLNTDYSKKHSARDRPGTDAASAIDIGSWPGRRGPAKITFLEFNAAVVAACVRGDARMRDMREWIYTPDGKIVKRWDRERKSTTGDSSHLFHTHGSGYRDSEGRRDRDDNLLGILKAIIEGEDMSGFGYPDPGMPIAEAYRMDALMAGSETVRGGPYKGEPMWVVSALKRLEQQAAADAARDAVAKAAIDALAAALAKGGGSMDAAAVIVRIDEVAAVESAAVATLQEQIARLHQQLAERDRLIAAAHAEAADGPA